MTIEPKYTVYCFESQDVHPNLTNPMGEVPDGWLVFNTTRPLYCTIDSQVSDRWAWTNPVGGKRGWFFAAVNPEDPRADELIKKNNDLHGFLCVWVTKAQVDETVKAYYESMWDERGYDRPIDWSLISNWNQTYIDIVTGEYDD